MKRFTALLILLGLLAPSGAGFAVHSAEAPETPAINEPTEPETPIEPPAVDPPTDPEEPAPDYALLLFEGLCAAIDNCEELYTFACAQPLDQELLSSVCVRTLEHVARFFYLHAIDLSAVELPAEDEVGNLYRYEFRPIYTFDTVDEILSAKAYVTEQTDAILQKLPDNATRLEQLLFLHDYLSLNFAYDGTHTVGDLYNLLQSGHGVCQAYVHLYAYLLDLLDIPNAFAISDEMNHVWNMVELDGSWYHIDLTWDDPAVDQAGRALHTNFLRSDAGITETGHTGFVAPYVCDSDLYETSFLPDLTGEILFLPDARYGISRSTRTLLKLDLAELTAETVADLSHLRWSVWDNPAGRWKDQYINLYYDGYLIYLNGPDSIWTFDPKSGALEQLLEFLPSIGYLYSLRGDGHTLTCTVSRSPGAAENEVSFTTPHRFAPATGGIFSDSVCLLCDYTEHYLSPVNGQFITPLLSARPAEGYTHDIRLLLLIDSAKLTVSAPLTLNFTLRSAEGDRTVTTRLSHTDYDLLLAYERAIAGGKEYSATDGYLMLGLILQGVEYRSYDSLQLTVAENGRILYRATAAADLLITPPELPEPPATEDVPTSEDAPAADEPLLPSDGEAESAENGEAIDSSIVDGYAPAAVALAD